MSDPSKGGVRVEAHTKGSYRDGERSFRLTLASREGKRTLTSGLVGALSTLLRGSGYALLAVIPIVTVTVVSRLLGWEFVGEDGRAFALGGLGLGLSCLAYLAGRPIAKALKRWSGLRKVHKSATLDVEPETLRLQDGTVLPRARVARVRVETSDSMETCSLVAVGDEIEDQTLFDSVHLLDVDEVVDTLRQAGLVVED